MKIAIEARYLSGNRAGVGRYIYNLLTFFKNQNDIQFVLYFDTEKDIPEIAQYFDIKILKANKLIWKHVNFPLEQKRNQYDLLFVPSYSAPVFPGCKSVVTIHDLVPVKFPEWSTKSQSLRFSWIVKHSARLAESIITVSEASKNDIVQLTGVDPAKVNVTYLGVDPLFRPLAKHEKENFTDEKSISDQYILYVGSIHPRRNLLRLIEAFKICKEKYDIPHRLKLTGMIFGKDADLVKLIEENGLEDTIDFLGFVSDEELLGFYNCADVFIYPSLYEGFGLPVIEAMACGTPVITSNVSSLPEISMGAALLVDPLSIDDITNAIFRIVSDKQAAQQFTNKGFDVCKKYRWEETANQTLNLFKLLKKNNL